MADQYLAFCEHDARDTVVGTETKYFLPIMGTIQPTFEPTDESRKEFRGSDTALGDTSVIRRSSQWTFSIECAYYPGIETGILLKHALGKAGTRNVYDTSAYKGILYPLSAPYGTGAELGDKALCFYPNTDEEGTTKSRAYYGGRIKSVSLKCEGTDDAKLIFEVVGPGEYIGSETTAIAGVSFPAASPYCSSDLVCYVGSGISRTGSAPDYTDLDPNTMDSFVPDSVNITITNGLDDKVVMNGVKGPSQTYRASQFSCEIAAPIDYDDPSSGFSSADEVKQIFSDVITSSLLLILDNGEDAGATENYQTIIDLPNLVLNPGTVQREADGTQPTVELKYKTLYSDTTEYPVGILTIDKASAY